MATIPKVKVTFDADLTGLKQGTNQAEAELSSFEKGVAKFSAAAKAAFAAAAAAAAAYAVKLGVDGVKAAIEDEQAQSRLAQTLEKAAGATNAQVKATEEFISKMQLATGVSDTQLRSAMGRLTLSTNDVTKAQDLLALSLDISKATGKSVESVANALGKAYDGQTTALGKLGIGLSSSELKAMSFTQVQQRLSDLFGGAAARNAETFQGKIDIMKQRFAEFQEGIGNALIPVLLNLFNFIETRIGPAFTFFKEKVIDPVSDAIMRNKDTFIGLFNFVKDNFLPLMENRFKIIFEVLGKAAGFVVDAVAFAIRAIEPIINKAIDGINLVIRGINLIKPGPDIASLSKLSTTPVYTSNPNLKIPTITSSTGGGGTVGGGSTGGGTGTSGAAKTIATTSSSTPTGVVAGTFASVGAKPFTQPLTIAGQTPTVTINVNAPSVIDEAGFTASVIQAFNNGTYRGTAGAGMLAGL